MTPSRDGLAAELFERHRRQVRGYLRGLTGSADLAEDLVQEVFVRVLRSADRYQPRDRDRAWLFRIAKNAFIDQVRRNGVRTEMPVIPAVSVAATQDLRVELRRALEALPDQERDAFLLAEVGGLSYAEIADTLEGTAPAVRGSIYRARQALRAALPAPPPMVAPLVRGERADD